MGKVRIIGGRWRGRKLEFPDKMNLRPTHDRIRETLFNWLMQDIAGATCLDLFAGSGALGFEALSRGAEKVYFVEKDSETYAALKKNAEKFDKESAEIIFADLEKNPPTFEKKIFDIVFLDPPYNSSLIISSLNWLLEKDVLKSNACLYLEMPKTDSPLIFEGNFRVLKSGATSRIQYYLLSNSR